MRYKSVFPLLLGIFLLVLTGMLDGHAQTEPPPATVVYSPEQLDQLLAPIALYPDALLAQILMAATYPLEVIEAYRWVSDPNNAQLRGDKLAAALEEQDWDPSVKSLVPFPQILKIMNDRLGWMQQIGDAFLAQQMNVMDAVQRLRARAYAAGTLQSTDHQTVVSRDQTIIIEPANPEIVYVPVYDPTVVYGTWPYPDYPPVYFAPFPGYAIVPGPFGWIGVGIVSVLWGWDDWDWHHHRIHIDHDRYSRINAHEVEHEHRPHITPDTWEHDPHHRRGVPYRDPVIRERFRPNPGGSPVPRLNFRGFESPPHVVPPPHGTAGSPTRGPAPARGPEPMPQNRAPAQPRGATAFENFTSGADARAASERSRASRQTMAPAPERAPQPSSPRRGGSHFNQRQPR
jgi:hypothetical protein